MTACARTDLYGFRLRGGENTRIEAFTDAAFAFAVTLLMIGGGHVPANVSELLAALRDLPGFAASFALLCLFWYAHYIWYRRYGIEDGRSVILSLLLVFLVLVYVYPLRMMFSAAFMSLSVGPPSTGFLPHSWSDMQLMFIVFGIAYASMSGVILLFHLHARKLRVELGLDARELEVTHAGIARWTINVAVAVASALMAWATPADASTIFLMLPGLAYWTFAFTGPLLRRRLRRRLAGKDGLCPRS